MRPGCGKLTARRHCDRHAEEYAARETARRAEADARRPSATARGYTSVDWRALRKEVLARDPICVLCKQKPSKHADHVVPKARGGRDVASNLQGVCHSCHSAKTAREDGGFGNPTAAHARAGQLRAAAARAGQ